ncbi:hypothetical protein ACIBI9_40580 [Nonomuraea sp. NPDC050451]|uniref:hypothetical protein n=1 Tax=Nonomuraea sp. NPDC050451 TaxID=3364364 RepID=UPI0037B2B0D7
MPAYADKLAEQLTSMAGDVPDTVEVVALAQPDPGVIQERLAKLVGTVADVAGIERQRPEVVTKDIRTTMRVPGRLLATGFHASGSMSVRLNLAPFEDVFKDDPGDEDLVALLGHSSGRLGIAGLLPAEDDLEFERLWRIKAAGGDRSGKVSGAVLCRAIGAFRHVTRGLPVYGRASATVELAAAGRLASVSVSARRFVDDGGGRTVATPESRRPAAAAKEVAGRIVKAFGDLEELKDVRLVPEWFRFGYLALGRRRSQAVLAPFYVASISVDRPEAEASAHVIAVPGTEDQFVRLPAGQRSSAPSRG